MAFADGMRRVREVVVARNRAVFHASVFKAHESITVGSSLTDAPGQPKLHGALRQSYQIEILSPTQARIASNKKYARSIEDGVSYAHGGVPLTIRSKVGGTHSIEKTALNFDRIVADAIRRVGGGAAAGEEASA